MEINLGPRLGNALLKFFKNKKLLCLRDKTGIDVADMKHLLNFVKMHPVYGLVFYDCQISPIALSEFFKGLKHVTLPYLAILCDTNVTDAMSHLLSQYIRSGKLLHLVLGELKLTPVGIQNILQSLQFSAIELLHLKNLGLGRNGVHTLANVLPRTDISVLWLTYDPNIGRDGFKELFRNLPPKITWLNIESSNVCAEDLGALSSNVRKYPRLVNLGLSGTVMGARELSMLLSITSECKLETVCLDNTMLKSSDVDLLIRFVRDSLFLKVLSIRANEDLYDNETMRTLYSGINGHRALKMIKGMNDAMPEMVQMVTKGLNHSTSKLARVMVYLTALVTIPHLMLSVDEKFPLRIDLVRTLYTFLH